MNKGNKTIESIPVTISLFSKKKRKKDEASNPHYYQMHDTRALNLRDTPSSPVSTMDTTDNSQTPAQLHFYQTVI